MLTGTRALKWKGGGGDCEHSVNGVYSCDVGPLNCFIMSHSGISESQVRLQLFF